MSCSLYCDVRFGHMVENNQTRAKRFRDDDDDDDNVDVCLLIVFGCMKGRCTFEPDKSNSHNKGEKIRCATAMHRPVTAQQTIVSVWLANEQPFFFFFSYRERSALWISMVNNRFSSSSFFLSLDFAVLFALAVVMNMLYDTCICPHNSYSQWLRPQVLIHIHSIEFVLTWSAFFLCVAVRGEILIIRSCQPWWCDALFEKSSHQTMTRKTK